MTSVFVGAPEPVDEYVADALCVGDAVVETEGLAVFVALALCDKDGLVVGVSLDVTGIDGVLVWVKVTNASVVVGDGVNVWDA